MVHPTMWKSSLMRIHLLTDRSKVLRYGTTVVLVALAIAWFFTLRPQSLGGPAAYVVVSGISMQPTYYDGDLVVMRRTNNYIIGDIIAYAVPEGEPGAGAMVIHRVIGRDSVGFITRGDNNNGNDQWRPTGKDIVGEQMLHVAGAGTLLARLRAPLIVASLAALFTMYYVLTWSTNPEDPGEHMGSRRPWRERLRRRRQPVERPEFCAALPSSQSPPEQEEARSTTVTAPNRQQPTSQGIPTVESARRWSLSFPSDPRASYALAALVAVLVACLALTSFQSGKDPSIK
jgi:signal peptidase I